MRGFYSDMGKAEECPGGQQQIPLAGSAWRTFQRSLFTPFPKVMTSKLCGLHLFHAKSGCRGGIPIPCHEDLILCISTPSPILKLLEIIKDAGRNPNKFSRVQE